MNEIHIELRILRYLRKHQPLDTSQMWAWIHSCRRRGGYTLSRFDQALKTMRDEGLIAVANGRWYIRAIPPNYVRELQLTDKRVHVNEG